MSNEKEAGPRTEQTTVWSDFLAQLLILYISHRVNLYCIYYLLYINDIVNFQVKWANKCLMSYVL